MDRQLKVWFGCYLHQPRVLNKDPTVWLDVVRPATAASHPTSKGTSRRSRVPHPQTKYVCEYMKIAVCKPKDKL
jgi:hypothetical protein